MPYSCVKFPQIKGIANVYFKELFRGIYHLDFCKDLPYLKGGVPPCFRESVPCPSDTNLSIIYA